MKAFGEKGEEAVKRELRQIHELKTYQPMDATKLTNEETKDAVPCRMIKTRKCPHG